MGDSAGGGLALALAQKIKFEGLPSAGQVILLSPWLDITLTNPAITEIDRMDPFLSVKGLKKAGLAYTGQGDANSFMISPINGDLNAIGKISIFVGSRDLLAADARKLNCLAKEQCIPINYREYQDMVHVWMFLSFPEARLAQLEIFDLIRRN
jgi:acetyl esterase/lipase